MFLPNLNILLEFAETPYIFFKKRSGLRMSEVETLGLTSS
jgi:hypothetical protein